MYQKNSLCFFILIFSLVSLWSQTDPQEEIQRLSTVLSERPPGPERRLLLKNRAALYEMLGQLQDAQQDYERLWQDFNDWDARISHLRLDYEMGRLDILDDLSRALMNAPLEYRIELVVLESRLLIALGHWDEGIELLDQYESLGRDNPAYLYERIYYHQLLGQLDRAQYWQGLLNQQSSSPENYILRGLAQERAKPSNLLGMHSLEPEEIFYYQVGAYSSRQGAMEMQNELLVMGIGSEITEVNQWYKILVPSSPAQDAELLDALQSLGIQPFRVSQ